MGDLSSIPGLGKAPGGGNGHPLQFSCLENLRDTGAWQARAWVVTNSQRGLNEHVRSTARTRTHRLVHTLLFPPLSLSSVKEAQPPSASPQRATRCLLKIYTAIIFQRTQPSKRPRKILFLDSGPFPKALCFHGALFIVLQKTTSEHWPQKEALRMSRHTWLLKTQR